MDIYSKLSDLEHKYEDIVHELSLEGAANDTKNDLQSFAKDRASWSL